jgi:hypothetical protein
VTNATRSCAWCVYLFRHAGKGARPRVVPQAQPPNVPGPRAAPADPRRHSAARDGGGQQPPAGIPPAPAGTGARYREPHARHLGPGARPPRTPGGLTSHAITVDAFDVRSPTTPPSSSAPTVRAAAGAQHPQSSVWVPARVCDVSTWCNISPRRHEILTISRPLSEHRQLLGYANRARPLTSHPGGGMTVPTQAHTIAQT